jgi:phenylacetate-CoA ligase
VIGFENRKGDPAMTFDPIDVFRAAILRVPAYRAYLESALGTVPEVRDLAGFAALPTTDKHGYIERFPLPEICLDGTLAGKHVICRSSGSSGEPVYWPQIPDQERNTERWVLDDLEALLAVSREPALAVVSLGLGAWISGELVTWSLRNVGMTSGAITLTTPGYNLEETVKILGRFSPLFPQTVLFSYPPFAKSILEAALGRGIPIPRLRIRLRLAGEGYSERYRDHVMGLLGYGERDACRIWSGYASTDFGRAGKETPLCVAVKRLLHRSGSVQKVFGTSVIPSVNQFDPRGFYLEEVDGELVITRLQGVPLVRYRTGDRGRILPCSEVLERMRGAGLDPESYLRENAPDLARIDDRPFVLVEGRADGGVTFFGANIIVEQVRDCIESDPTLSSLLTGAFQIHKSDDAALTPVLDLCLEALGEPGHLDPGEAARLVAKQLAARSSEYGVILEAQGEKALPRVTFVPKGALQQDVKVRYVRKK